jgi:hypothetical protein
LTANPQAVRKERAQKPLNKPVEAGKCEFITTAKIFKVNIAFSRRYLSDLPVSEVDPNIRIFPFFKELLNQTLLGIVGKYGQKCHIIFVASCKNVNTDVYQQILRQHVVPWIQRTYPGGNYSFQQV